MGFSGKTVEQELLQSICDDISTMLATVEVLAADVRKIKAWIEEEEKYRMEQRELPESLKACRIVVLDAGGN